ncbi:MAG: class I SAM-dependent methyltransferase [Pseudomonadales bacterium]|nr:class I SAM-dependent methyltransferase [Pseudomonadales bacterium]
MKPSPWVVKYADNVPAKSKVLDLACGMGRHTRLFIERGCHVTAVDIDTKGVQDLMGNPDCRIIETDLEQSEGWILPLGFDCIVVTNYLYRPMLKHLVKALVPGGILIYQTFMLGNEKFGKPSNPEFLLTADELKETYEHKLEVIAFSQGLSSTPSMTQQICARRSL